MHAGRAGWVDAELSGVALSAASSDLTQQAVFGSQTTNADANNTN